MLSGPRLASLRRLAALASSLALVGALGACTVDHEAGATPNASLGVLATAAAQPATPIQHLVVLYMENESFDHYFGVYPHALNPKGEPAFHAAPGTPRINGLTPALLTHNPNGVNPKRLDRSQLLVCSNDHSYAGEQVAFDHGRMDRFVSRGGEGGCAQNTVMDYYDGNTVTALWNYAQRFTMSDNSHGATFGPTLPGHLNLAAGQTHGVIVSNGASIPAVANGTVIGNTSPIYDQCHPKGQAPTTPRVAMTGRNIGDLLSAAGVSWGSFSAGFRPTSRNPDGSPVCGASHRALTGKTVRDYGANSFQYWRSTSNPAHLRPASVAEIGHNGPANHQYGLADFFDAARAGRMPAVSFIQPPAYANGHPGWSDPLDEQQFLVSTINRIQNLPSWRSTAIVIAYDDSDGWYDHAVVQPTNPSYDRARDSFTAPGQCGSGPALAHYQDRCGPGPRLPFLLISPYAKVNWVDHNLTTQVSIIHFIENNWLHGQRIGNGSLDESTGGLGAMFAFRHPHFARFLLDPQTGLPR